MTVKVTIDGIELEVESGLTVIQACEEAGIEVPRFCYHEKLSISGNCRMCLVEMERAPKPIASCAMPVSDGMVIHTDTEKVRKMRRSVMEFLLINHPLDCPICDQGGECDLQDQALAYGMDKGRYIDEKRAASDIDFGPLIRGVMTRCIHCTRCVRFSTEVAGTPEMGGTGRGEHLSIGTYVSKALSSELSGNMVDLCPVGALTSAPYAFTARPWELKKTESIDALDAMGSNIRIDARGRQVMRVLPRVNEDVNEEWISDKSRFACDGLLRRRLDQPWVKDGGKLRPASWDEAFSAIKGALDGLDGPRIGAIAGDLADCESMTALKDLMAALGSPHLDCRQDGAALDPTRRAGYLFNSGLAAIDEADALLLVGTNPRWEAPVLNARIRKRWMTGKLSVGLIGLSQDLTYPYNQLGESPRTLGNLADGKHEFAKILKAAERPMMIVGMGALTRKDSAAVMEACHRLAEAHGLVKEGWNGFNVLHTAAARVGGLDLGFVPGQNGRGVADIVAGAASGDLKVVYLLGADEIDASGLGDAFVIYQGHHGDVGAARADVILPGAAYTEKSATYVNTEGRAQQAQLAVFPPGDAREDWKIVRALSAHLGKPLGYDTLADVRARMAEISPIFAAMDERMDAAWGAFGVKGEMEFVPFVPTIENFYMTDPISRASETMARCTEVILGVEEGRTGTDG